MANALLDFVMSLVRDPDAAARYAENPEQAIADANLTNVTSVDVSSLIPVVSESLSTPSFGAGNDAAGNVWESGEAVSAFDAFDTSLPTQTAESDPMGHHVIDPFDDMGVAPGVEGGGGIAELVDTGLDAVPAVATLDEPPIPDAAIDDWAGSLDAVSPDIDHLDDVPGFDAFNA